MNLDTETASPDAVSNGRDGSDATITRASETSESSSSYRGLCIVVHYCLTKTSD